MLLGRSPSVFGSNFLFSGYRERSRGLFGLENSDFCKLPVHPRFHTSFQRGPVFPGSFWLLPKGSLDFFPSHQMEQFSAKGPGRLFPADTQALY